MKRFLSTVGLCFSLLSVVLAQNLQFQPKPISAQVYPGNPLPIGVTFSGTDPVPTVSATLRLGQGGIVLPPSDQPTVSVSGRTATVAWANYSPAPSVRYLEIQINGYVQIAVTITASFKTAQTTNPTSVTVNPTGILPVQVIINGGGAGSGFDLVPLLNTKASRDSVYTRAVVDQLLAPKVSPSGRLRKVMVIGSSHAYGQGATNLMGWTKLLGQKLSTTCQFIHLAVPGTDTPYWINRIEADLKANRPDYVLIGLSLGNEWINIPDHNVAYKQFYSNMNLLAEFCRQNGAIPIIASTYPRGDFNAADYLLIKNMSRQLGDLGYFMIDILGVCDDGTGHYLPQFDSGDGLHVNDAGAAAHAAMAVPGIFRTSQAIMQPLRADKTTPGVRMPATQTAAPIVVAINSYASITVGFEVRADVPNMDVKALALLVNSANTRLRIRTPNNQIWLGDVNSGLVSSTTVIGTSWTHVAIRYNHATGVAGLFINGVKQGEGNIGAGLLTTQVMLGGTETAANTATGHDFRNLTIHVAPLTDESIRDLSRGIITRGSLLNFSTLSEGNPVFLNQVFRNEDGLVVFPISGFSN